MSEFAERKAYLFLLVDRLLEERNRWIEDPSQQIVQVDGPIWSAVKELIDVFAIGSIPGTCREIEGSVNKFREVWESFSDRAKLSPEAGALPGALVWKAIENIELARESARPKPPVTLESIQELVSQKVSHGQIARIYDWYREDDSPDLEKVRDAIANPGKHDGKNYVSKAQRDRDESDEKMRRNVASKTREALSRERSVLDTGKEELLQLVDEGVTAKQISKIKKVSIDEVFRQCDEAGIKRPKLEIAIRTEYADVEPMVVEDDKDYAVEHPLAAAHGSESDTMDRRLAEPDMLMTEPGGDAAAMTLEQQVLQALDDGLSPKEIAQAFEITPQKVGSIRRRRNEIEIA